MTKTAWHVTTVALFTLVSLQLNAASAFAGSQRLSLTEGYDQDQGGYNRMEYRFALHDFSDPQEGYPELTQWEIGKLAARYTYRDSSLLLDEVTAIRVTSLTPLTDFDRQFSWEVRLAGQRFYDNVCDHCFGGVLEFGAGFAGKFFGGEDTRGAVTYYLLAEGEVLTGSAFTGAHFRPGLGPTAGLRVQVSEALIGVFRGGYRYRFLDGPHDSYFGEGTVRWGFMHGWSLEVSALMYPDPQQASAGVSGGLSYYF